MACAEYLTAIEIKRTGFACFHRSERVRGLAKFIEHGIVESGVVCRYVKGHRRQRDLVLLATYHDRTPFPAKDVIVGSQEDQLVRSARESGKRELAASIRAHTGDDIRRTKRFSADTHLRYIGPVRILHTAGNTNETGLRGNRSTEQHRHDQNSHVAIIAPAGR